MSIRDILVAALCVPFTLDSEIISLNWRTGEIYCICYRYFYYCFLFFLPLTLLFLSWHLFVENCKWNFAGEEGVVPRPWPHTIFIPLIWFFSALFAVPTVFWSDVRPYTNDFYRNEISYRPLTDAKVLKLPFQQTHMDLPNIYLNSAMSKQTHVGLSPCMFVQNVTQCSIYYYFGSIINKSYCS